MDLLVKSIGVFIIIIIRGRRVEGRLSGRIQEVALSRRGDWLNRGDDRFTGHIHGNK